MTKNDFCVSLPGELYKKIEEKFKEAGFNSVDEFVVKKLEEAFGQSGKGLSNDDEEKVKERLKALGYMD